MMRRTRFLAIVLAATVAQTLVAGAASAATPRITWMVTTLRASASVKPTRLISTPSPGTKTWRVFGACSLRSGLIVVRSSGSCRVTVTVARWGSYSRATASRSFAIRASSSTTTTAPPPSINYVPFVPPGDPAASAPRVTGARFDFTGAVGLVMRASVSGASSRQGISVTGSNLLALLASGETKDALTLGNVTVDKFMVAPNDRVYLKFVGSSIAVPLLDGAPCFFAQVYRATGEVVCLESGAAVTWQDDDSAVQFDGAGNIYYLTGNVVRRYSAGTAADYVNLYQGANKWFVMRNGDVIVGGRTTAGWTRRITPAGVVTTIAAEQAGFIRYFPDGDVYLSANLYFKRISSSSGEVSTWDPGTGAVGFGGDMEWFYTSTGEVYVDAASVTFQRLYPTYKRDFVSIANTTSAVAVGKTVVLAGTTSSGANRMVRYDPVKGSETVLVGNGGEVEIYNVRWSPSNDRIYFDGLRFSDNKYVLGYVNNTTLEVQMTPSPFKVGAFRTFAG